jgi:hypothetical protein
MINIKYNGFVHTMRFEEYVEKIEGAIFKILPLYEKNQYWETHLESLLNELIGANEIFFKDVNFISLICKLEGLKNKAINKEKWLFKKIILDCVPMVKLLSLNKERE